MKTLLIVAAIIVFLVHGFVMYCCIKVGAESEKNYDELAKGVRKEKGSKKTLESHADPYPHAARVLRRCSQLQDRKAFPR